MRWSVFAVYMILCVKLNVQGASLVLEEEEEFAEVNEEVPELSEVNEELAEQNAEGGTQPQSGTQAQVGFQLPSGTFVNPGIGFPTLQAFPTQVGFGAPFRFAQGTYPAVLGGGFPAPRVPAQTFPQAFNPSAGFAPLGLNRAMRGVGDPFLGVNFMPSGGPFFYPYGDGGYSLVPNSYNLRNQGQGQNPDDSVGVVDRGQRELTGNPMVPPAQAPKFPPPGFIDNPAISIPGGSQGELGSPQDSVPADGPNSFIPLLGPFPGGLPTDFDQQGTPPLPGNYYPQPGSYYPQQSPPGGNSGPQGLAPGDVFVPGGFNAQAAGGIPGTYDPLDPSEYGTQFFNRALQTRLLSSIFGGGKGTQGTSGSGTGRASQGAAATLDGSSVTDPFTIMPFYNPTVFNPYGAPGALAAPPFNPRGDGFSPFFPNTFSQQQPGSPSANTNPVSPSQPAGTDGFFPFSAADIPPPSPQSNNIAIRELSGRGIPSVSAVAPEEEVPATDDGK